jgi:hypothetical protein
MGHNHKDIISISSIFLDGQKLIDSSSSTDTREIKKFLNERVYFKTHDLIQLFTKFYQGNPVFDYIVYNEGEKEFSNTKFLIKQLKIYCMNEVKKEKNFEAEYFQYQSMRLFQIIKQENLQTLRTLLHNPLFSHLVQVLANNQLKNSDFYQKLQTAARDILYNRESIEFNINNLKAREIRYYSSNDNLNTQIFILFEAMKVLDEKEIPLMQQLRNPLLGKLIGDIGNKLYLFVGSSKLGNCYDPRTPYLFQGYNDSFHHENQGYWLIYILDLLRLSIKNSVEAEHDINHLESASFINPLSLKSILKKWKINFQDSPQFLLSLPEELLIQTDIQKALFKLKITLKHFRENTDFIQNYKHLVLLIDRWFTQGLYRGEDLTAYHSFEEIEELFLKFKESQTSEFKVKFLDYLFIRLYEQHNTIISGRKIDFSRIKKLDEEIDHALNRFPDILGHLSKQFWKIDDNFSFFSQTSSRNIKDTLESISPRSGSPVRELRTPMSTDLEKSCWSLASDDSTLPRSENSSSNETYVEGMIPDSDVKAEEDNLNLNRLAI